MLKYRKTVLRLAAIILMMGVTVMFGACGFFGSTQVPNPWAETDGDGIKAVMGITFNVPESAEYVTYMYNSSLKLGEMQFYIGSVKYCARIQNSSEYTDISGMYYTWDSDEATKDFDGAEARIMKFAGENETINVVEAFYNEAQLQYCLSAVSRKETVGNLIAIAKDVWGEIPGAPVTPTPTEEPTEAPTEEPETDPYAKILEFAQTFIGKTYDEIVEVLGEPAEDSTSEEGLHTISYDEFYLILNEENVAQEAVLLYEPETSVEPETEESEATPEC